MEQETQNTKNGHDFWRPQPELGMSDAHLTPDAFDESGEETSPAKRSAIDLIKNVNGRVGYVLAWLLGVPAWILLLVFLVRGH